MVEFAACKDGTSGWAIVVHTFNPSTQEAEAGGSLWVRGQPGLQKLIPGQAPKLQWNPALKNHKKDSTSDVCIISPNK